LIGVIIGFWYNLTYNYPLLPSPLTRFAVIAPLIGTTEELVFRGYVQTKSASAGSIFSIVFASFGHTLYKYLVICTLPVDLGLSLTKLILLTFSFGIVAGILRHYSRSVIPPAIAHALFDIIVYGGAASAPVWIWG
jgi:membrane protease YdiL (CAAX protease family)